MRRSKPPSHTRPPAPCSPLTAPHSPRQAPPQRPIEIPSISSARSSLALRDAGGLHSRFVLRSGAGTILLSGTQWPIASFGSPGGHSLSVGTPARRPGPEFQWILSPVTGLSPSRRIARCRHHSPLRRSSADLHRRHLELLRVVLLFVAPERERYGSDLTRNCQLRQVRLCAAVQQA